MKPIITFMREEGEVEGGSDISVLKYLWGENNGDLSD
jgi:hypothetical protein